MKKRHVNIKSLCLFLTVIFLFQTNVLAESISETITIEPTSTESALVEVASLREESVKTFQTENGNYVAAIYGEAVHYQDEDGNWQEIDNSLVPTTMSAAQLANVGVNVTDANTLPVAYRKNASNPFEVNLPNTLTVNNPITVTYKGHTLGFSLQGISSQSGTVAEVLNTTSRTEAAQLEEYSIISKDSIFSYGQVFPNTQLTYEMRGKKLKESLIFSAPPTLTNFVFRFYYEQLYPELLPTGEVRFYADITKSEEPIFVISAPYMFDSGEGYSADIDVELVPVTDGCLYRLTPDSEWLNAEERVYPVTLDPTVTTSLTQTEIHDNSVHQSDPNTNYINADRLYVGSVVLSSGTFESRTYIKFPRVSSIPTTAFIVNATMTLNHHANSSYQSASNNTIDVYDCGSNVWGTSNITWNTQKDFVFTNRICSRVTDKSQSVEDFDVTTLVRSWYSTTASNNGLVIKPRTVYTNASNRTGYYSSDISSSISSKRPYIVIEYYNDTPSSGIIPNAIYFIRNVYSNKYISVPSNGGSQTYLTQQEFTGASCQKFQTRYMGGGIYSLIPQHNTSLRIDVKNTLNQDGADLWTYTVNDTASQYFRIIANGDGSYRLMPLNSTTRVMDVEGPSTANGAKIQIWTWDPSANQMKWKFEIATKSHSGNIYVGTSSDSYDSRCAYGARTSNQSANAFAQGVCGTMSTNYNTRSVLFSHRNSNASKNDFRSKELFNISTPNIDDVDIMLFVGHGTSNNGLHFSYRPNGDGTAHGSNHSLADLNFSRSEAYFGYGNSKTKWVFAYTCNFLNGTDDSIKQMFRGVHGVFGYSTVSYLVDSQMLELGLNLKLAETSIKDAYLACGHFNTQYNSDSATLTAAVSTQAIGDTIYSYASDVGSYPTEDITIFRKTYSGHSS